MTPARAVKLITRVASRIRSERRIRNDIDLLTSYDDNMLVDIGLRRTDIEYVVRHGRPSDRNDN